MFLAAVGLLGLLVGVGSSEVRRFENAAARDISTRLIGEQKLVKVRTKMDPIAAIGGHLKSATITASGFQTEGLPFFTESDGSKAGKLNELKFSLNNFILTGLPVVKFEARIPDCRFDFGLARRKGQIRLTQSGIGFSSVVISQDGLATFVMKKFPTLRDLKIRLLKDVAEISGAGRFVILDCSFRIRTRMTSPDGNQLVMMEPEIWVNEQRADSNATKAILGILNPVLDLDKDLKLFAALRVKEVSLMEGELRASGTATIPTAPTGTH